MKAGWETNIEEVFNSFCQLTQKEMTSAVRKALRTGAVTLKKQTQENITSSLQKRNNPHWDKGEPKTYNDKIEDAVRISKINNGYGDGEEMSIKVHIMGTRAEESGTFRARFLEMGTKNRYAKSLKGKALKKPRYLGKIAPKWFFRSANAQVEPQLQRIYIEAIDKACQKINNSKI